MRIPALVAVVAGIVCISACDDNNHNILSTGGPSGVFILQTFDGRQVPTIVVDSAIPPIRVDIISGSLTINADLTFGSVTELRAIFAGIDSTRLIECTGTFAATGNVLTLIETGGSPNCGRTFTGTLAGGTFTTTLFGDTAVYAR